MFENRMWRSRYVVKDTAQASQAQELECICMSNMKLGPMKLLTLCVLSGGDAIDAKEHCRQL